MFEGMQRVLRRRCDSCEPCAGYVRLVRLAALYTHSGSLGLNPPSRSRTAGSLPVQKSQTSDRASHVKKMGFGIEVKPSLGLGLQRVGCLRSSGVTAQGSVSTKVFGRKLVAQSVEHDRNSLKKQSEAMSRAGLASSFEESNAVIVSRRTGESTSLGASDAVCLQVYDWDLQKMMEFLDWKYSLKGKSEAMVRAGSNVVDLGFVSREIEGSTCPGESKNPHLFISEESPCSSSSDRAMLDHTGDLSPVVRISEEFTSQMKLGSGEAVSEQFNGDGAGTGEVRNPHLVIREEPTRSSSSDPSDMAMLDNVGDVSVSENFISEMKLGSGESVSGQFNGGSGVRNMGAWGAMQPLPGDEGVAVVCKQGLGAGIGRQMALRASAVSKGAVETVGTESGNPGVEGDVLDRVEKLRQVISDYSYRYHTLDNPVVSDSAYDALVRELKELESQLPVEASKESVTGKVGAPPSLELAKVRHAVPMLSLAAVYKEDELRAWHERLQQRLSKVSDGEQPSTGAWVVEPKVDGLALTLRYEEGRLVCAATRGDGSEGEDVTYNARNLTGISQVLPELHGDTNLHESVVEVRGEVYMTLLDFQELNAIKVKAGEKPFANPRNAAAGSIRILKNRDAENRRLSFMAYAIVSAEDTVATGVETSGQLAKTQWVALNLLKNMGFSVNEDNRKFDSFEDALDYATRWRDSRPSLKYESDGVIFKVNDLAVQAKLGAVGSDPRWAVAWKFAATEVVTVLEGIELTIGRSGAIIPNARLKPVELGGVTISRASLHNFGMVEKLGICEGDHVVVQRAGDVIPQVVQVLKALRPDHVQLWVPPERCPSCDGELTVSKDKTMTSCCNNKCPGRHSRKIEHFAKTLFKGLGPAILGDLQDAGMVGDPADFYALEAVTLSRLEGLGKKSATKLVKAIEESKGKSLWELITALGIPAVGVSAAKLLEKWFGSMDRLLLASKEELQLVPGVGTASAAAIQDWCTNPFNVLLVSRIKEAGFAPTFNDPEIEKQATISASSDSALEKTMSKAPRTKKVLSKKSEVKSAPSNDDSRSLPLVESSEMEGAEEILEQPPLQGKNVVITGEFEDYSREELEQLVILNGGQIRKSVSSKTSFIVAGQFPGPSKMAKAAQLEIPVHDLSTFQQLLDHDSASVPDFKQAMSG